MHAEVQHALVGGMDGMEQGHVSVEGVKNQPRVLCQSDNASMDRLLTHFAMCYLE